jgi:hypothetical protein
LDWNRFESSLSCDHGFGERVVTIVPFLTRQPFDPELLRNMSAAFENTCRALKLPADGSAAETVARTIIELAQRGVHDRAELSAMALRQLRPGG